MIVFDAAGRIDTVNPGATRILRAAAVGLPRPQAGDVPGAGRPSRRPSTSASSCTCASPEAGEREQWQDAFELQAGRRQELTLLVRGALLPGDARLMVFDDITEVVSAQRSAAWSEVARRLAHEIKNPLTPIQLSAERLQHKLESQARQGADQAHAAALGRHHRHPGAGDEAAGQRVPRLRAPAGGAAASRWT